ncbi:hypothetical protein [Dipodfec virus UOA04_Rod_734]|nr:hypothetical protein [Dipodfec virus UOA04_Rod_734]
MYKFNSAPHGASRRRFGISHPHQLNNVIGMRGGIRL